MPIKRKPSTQSSPAADVSAESSDPPSSLLPDLPALPGFGTRRVTAGELGLTYLDLTWAEESFSPVQYFKFMIGPISARFPLKPEDDVLEASAKGMALLDRMARAAFEQKLKGHLERVKESGEALKQS